LFEPHLYRVRPPFISSRLRIASNFVFYIMSFDDFGFGFSAQLTDVSKESRKKPLTLIPLPFNSRHGHIIPVEGLLKPKHSHWHF
jgi:hypothetical protein